MTNTQTNAQPQPGSLFDVPGVPGGATQWYEGYEPIEGVVNNLSAQTQTTANGLSPFQQTDVVLDWQMDLEVNQDYVVGTGQTLTDSPYAPFNVINAYQIKIQNTWNSVDVENGIDLYAFNQIRPEYKFDRTNDYASIQGQTLGSTGGNGVITSSLSDTNQVQKGWTNALSSYPIRLRIPASQWFDRYFNLDANGEPIGPSFPALVSPVYLGGTTRNITPHCVFAPGFVSGLDVGPVNTTTLTASGDTASTYTGSVSQTYRRTAIFNASPVVMPEVYPWQYRWKTTRGAQGGVSGQSKITVLIPQDSGQILSWYLRLWDPSANGGLGAPVSTSNITNIKYVYGSNLARFNGTVADLQARWYRQHGKPFIPGAIVFDDAITQRGQITNERCLNTIATGNMQVEVSFSSPLSSTAYAVLGVESLTYVI